VKQGKNAYEGVVPGTRNEGIRNIMGKEINRGKKKRVELSKNSQYPNTAILKG